MPISNAINTASLPGINEQSFFIAPKTQDDAVAAAGWRTMHFVSDSVARSQALNDDPEYGGDNSSVDASDPIAGDISVSGNLSTRLCLNESCELLGYAMGASTPSGDAPNFEHVFKSGKAQLPIFDGIFEAAGGRKTIDKAVLGGFSMAFGREAAFQKIDFRVTAREADFAAENALAGAAPSYNRDFITKAGWDVLINDVAIGRLLTSSLDFNTNINEDRYLGTNLTADDFYVGNATLTGTHRIRYSDAAALGIYQGPAVPHKLEFVGTSLSGKTISILMPRVSAPRPSPKQDGTLLDYDVTWAAAKVEGETPQPMMTVTVQNSTPSF